MEAISKPAIQHQGAGGRTLVVYGSFAKRQLEKAVSDWSRVVVLEVDGYLPEPLRSRCAAVLTIPPLLPEREAEMLQARSEDLLDRFLEDRVSAPGLVTDRRFRAACMSIEAWRIVVPHVVCLEYARRVMPLGPWEGILLAPGVGVSRRAFEQLGRALGVPVRTLPFDQERPPFHWMLRRKWQRARTKHASSPAAAAAVPRLPAFSQEGGFWCADPRLEAMLARSDAAGRWVRGPGFAEPDAEEINTLRGEYEKWWEAWWADWQRAQPADDPMADHLILEDLGRWLSRERYPRHALLLRQAQEAVQRWKPARVLTGSMRGREAFLWGLAAQDHGIPAAVYTIDCHIDPRLCFKPDLVLCDDMRQWDIATQSGSFRPGQIVQVRSHRQPPERAAGAVVAPRRRKRLLLADTYYSGMVASSQPLLSLWAYQRVIEAAKALPEHDFVIKYHPVRERPEPTFHHSGLHHLHLWLRDGFIRNLKPPANLTLLPPEVRLSEELEAADILLNIQSYAGLEAFALQIPVIYLQPWDEEGLYPRMNQMGVMQVAVDTPRLVELIRRNLSDADHVGRQLALQSGYLDYFYLKDGSNLAEAAMQ